VGVDIYYKNIIFTVVKAVKPIMETS